LHRDSSNLSIVRAMILRCVCLICSTRYDDEVFPIQSLKQATTAALPQWQSEKKERQKCAERLYRESQHELKSKTNNRSCKISRFIISLSHSSSLLLVPLSAYGTRAMHNEFMNNLCHVSTWHSLCINSSTVVRNRKERERKCFQELFLFL
jgi:hypothetical protein